MGDWFERLADEVPAPLFLYNIPGTTRMSIPIETVIALSEHPNVAGIKDSEYAPDRMGDLLGRLGDRADFAYFVGPTAYAARGLSLGAAGFIPGAGNLVPDLCQRLQASAARGDREAVGRFQALLSRVGDTYQASRTVSRAIPLIKAGMSGLGLCGPTVLPPLMQADPTERTAMMAVLGEIANRVSARA
jgi:4-hydroxy-tetrahydrodipicolinate synthase